MPDYDEIKSIRNFKSLVRYLRTELGWPIDEDDVETLYFEYEPRELGLEDDIAVKIREIKQVRPLVEGQPWGIFWIDFEPKRLPVVAMRRILGALVRKKRTRDARQAVWNLPDLMFISATGEGNQRGINFAHFRETRDGLPQLRTFSWDASERHFYYLEKINLAALHWPRDENNAGQWREQWASAFTSAHGENIRTAKDLATEMADLAAATREQVKEAFRYERGKGPLNKLYSSFKTILISDLSVDDFADMYAQTVAYGLFSAAVEHSGQFQRENVASLVPNTNPFLSDLLKECLKVSADARYHIDLDELGVGELVEALQSANLESVLQDFGKLSHGHTEDPVIHFYESFLREYDAEKKVKRGVFYTPDAVVSFILRSVDYLLRTEFDCPDGLADTGTMTWKGKTVPKVQVLDPATGTGTFLKYVIEQIYETFTNRAVKRGLSPTQIRKEWNEYVPKHLLPRLYGFELMMAPYAVAHMKLGLALRETEYNFGSNERLRVYLTNTLQPAHEIPRTESLSLAHEADEANDIKEKTPVTVVIGNPPYAGHSANASYNEEGEYTFIGDLLRTYYQVDGKPLGERNPKWLQDDYVKFIRFGQWRINETGHGILAMITNHSYLDNPTFRGMRQQLMQSFEQIYVFDLHGNSKKKETAPDGSPDENVFDIQQGVAICLMLKGHRGHGQKSVAHADLFGQRENKYRALMGFQFPEVAWARLAPQSPFYLWVPHSSDLQAEYSTGWKVPDILPIGNMGITTGKDAFVTNTDREVLVARVRDLADGRLSTALVRERYDLEDSSSFSLEHARAWAKKLRRPEQAIRQIGYRAFDDRFVIYSRAVLARDREDVCRHMMARQPNLGLVTFRATRELPWQHVGCTNKIITKEFLSSLDNCYLFPLYRYSDDTLSSRQDTLFPQDGDSGPTERYANFSRAFVNDLRTRLNLEFIPHGTGDLTKTIGPEVVFHYIYAILHSPTYRERYAEFLKIDFPRIPLTRNLDLFRTLAAKGAELVALHLMESPALKHPITEFVGRGNNTVATGYPKYERKTVWINEEQGFESVPKDVWEFQVGGYQVCHKWLKDRRGRKLTADDRKHFAEIVVALKETIQLMKEIDDAVPAWPIE